MGVAWAYIDGPRFRYSIRQTLPVESERAHLRLRGRNYKKSWHRRTGKQRYNYLYAHDELFFYAELLEERKEADGTTTYVFFNNHFGGKAAANPLQRDQPSAGPQGPNPHRL
ncbi:MAG: DUF72 domain-containing protein [Nitrospinota bacterium]